MLGAARAAATSRTGSGSALDIAPFCAPCSRICRISARVSISVSPTTPAVAD